LLALSGRTAEAEVQVRLGADSSIPTSFGQLPQASCACKSTLGSASTLRGHYLIIFIHHKW